VRTQIWVNLPHRFKWADPAYQDVPKEKIPVIIMNKYIVRVIAGEAFGQKAIVNTKVPIQLLDVHMESGAEFKHNIPSYVRPALTSSALLLALPLACERLITNTTIITITGR
jgi:redox-sensitive bicupin YhaK (pirin superfamily)